MIRDDLFDLLGSADRDTGLAQQLHLDAVGVARGQDPSAAGPGPLLQALGVDRLGARSVRVLGGLFGRPSFLLQLLDLFETERAEVSDAVLSGLVGGTAVMVLPRDVGSSSPSAARHRRERRAALAIRTARV